MASGVVPIEGPQAVSSLFPVARSHSGARSRYAAVKPPEFITLISAPSAVPAKCRILTPKSATAAGAIDLIFMTDPHVGDASNYINFTTKGEYVELGWRFQKTPAALTGRLCQLVKSRRRFQSAFQ